MKQDQMVNTEIRLIIFFAAKDGEALSIQSIKTRQGVDYGSDHELLIAKFRFTLKKVGKTTRPFDDIYLACFIFSISYSVLLFQLVYVFSFSLFFFL